MRDEDRVRILHMIDAADLDNTAQEAIGAFLFAGSAAILAAQGRLEASAPSNAASSVLP
jgi:hypothetical protein